MTPPPATYRNRDLLADAGRWPELLELCRTPGALDREIERCEIAHVLALEAPADLAAAAVELFAHDDPFYLGPPWEVAAHRPWAQLAPHLSRPRTRDLVAHSRVLQGEDLSADPSLDPGLLGAPFALEPWELAVREGGLRCPRYGRRSGSGSIASFPNELAGSRPLPAPDAPEVDHEAVAPLAALSEWAEAYAFRGTAWQAASAVASGQSRRRGKEFTFAQAYLGLLYLAAGSAAYGPARGHAVGRVTLWGALAAMAGGPEHVTAMAERLRCVGWQEPDDEIWFVHLAIEDPAQGLAWVVNGQDFD